MLNLVGPEISALSIDKRCCILNVFFVFGKDSIYNKLLWPFMLYLYSALCLMYGCPDAYTQPSLELGLYGRREGSLPELNCKPISKTWQGKNNRKYSDDGCSSAVFKIMKGASFRSRATLSEDV